MWFTNYVVAHEMTPTYPELRPSYMEDVYVTSMEVFNTREEVEYYEIEVMDAEFNTLPFATKSKIVNIKYLSHVKFDVYVRELDLNRAVYICTTSRLKKDSGKNTMIATKICSKFKHSSSAS
jgi:hypothetical protein